MENNNGLPLVKPKVVPELDSSFRPAVLANRAFQKSVRNSPDPIEVNIALSRNENSISRFQTNIFSAQHPEKKGNLTYLERIIKFLLWSRGAGKIYLSAPLPIVKQLQECFKNKGHFDAQVMGNNIYDTEFEILPVPINELPEEKEHATSLGRNLDQCRIGFDLGASDRKAAALIDGKVVFSEEILWNPLQHTDPQWHFDQIMDSLLRAAEHLPRVDAIGGSAAGVYVENKVKIASLFRGIPEEVFRKKVMPLFLDIKKQWHDIPFEVINDGEVTALAGAMSIGNNGVLGIALGSSQAAGYVTQEGRVTTWLNEFAFAPIDYAPEAPLDEWSGDRGCGVQYFSQQCVGRLLRPAGIKSDATWSLPQKLEFVQEKMKAGDQRAASIYRTIGAYLGYAIAHYADFYDISHLLILGRVTTGDGGSIIMGVARKILKSEFPELDEKIAFHIPNEKEKRHGQAIAAASLPFLN